MRRVILFLLLSLMASLNIQAQVTTVGAVRASSANGSARWSVALSPVAGDTLLVGCDYTAGIVFNGVSDSAGDSFVQIGAGALSQDFGARAYLATSIKGGATTVTCTASSAPQYNEIYVTELRGVDPVHPLDTQVWASGPVSPAKATLTTAHANELVWAYLQSGQTSNASGWTALSTFDGNLIADRTQATAGTLNASFSVTSNWTLILAALNPAAGGSTTPNPVSVATSPATASVQVNQQSGFSSTVQNDTQNRGVTWSLSGGGCSGTTCGTLSNITASSVTYTAPAAVPSSATVTLTATSVTDTTKSASSAITITAAPAITVVVSPSAANASVNQSTSFTATVQNDVQSKGVAWSLSGSGCSATTCGTLSNVTSTSVTYIAPSVVPNPATILLSATSVADSSKTGGATITVTSAAQAISTVGPTVASSAFGSSKWSVALSPVAGDTLLVGCDYTAGIVFNGVSDSAGDSFVQIGAGALSQDFGARAYLATSIKGGATTVTCTASSAPQYNEIYVTELRGVDPVHPLDTQVWASGPVSPAKATLTTAHANELVWAYLQSGQTSNASGWTALSTFDGNLIADRTQATAGTLNASFSVTSNWTLILAALNPAAGGSTTPNPVSVATSPATASVQVNQQSGFSSTVQNDTQNRGVTWSLSGGGCSGTTCG